ncbi:DUF4136 domain-containing protein [Luteimonas vadosa]|uniref:DUF4136 domain-containing protein n=1 Tax=Luteimonas vadosa TaxID=1165507 RepID=A0ABP9DZ59_9GAMM
MKHLVHTMAIRWLAAVFALALLGGCATGLRVSAEADPRADFSQYRTYGFYSPLAVEGDGYATPSSQRMREAVRSQMESRGYSHSAEKPDLLVNINAYVQQRTDVWSSPFVDYGYYYSYRAHRYVVAPYWRDRVDVYRYNEGTLNIDIIDAARNTLVWEGIAVGRATRSRPADRDARIDAAIAEIFARYPYRAGSR